MLEEKIRQAGQAHATSSKRMLILAVIVACFLAIVIAGMTFIDNASPPPVSDVAIKVIAPQELAKQREQFKQQLRAYATDIAPALADANLKSWNRDKDIAIKILHDKATTAFANSDYTAALKALADATSMAMQVLAQREENFSSQLMLAKQAVNAEKASEATLHISKALQLKPSNAEALNLAQRINALPNILALLKKSSVAQTENNLEKEYAAVAEAFQLAPNWPGLKQRKQALAEQIKEHQFASLLSLGLQQVKKKQIRAARSSFERAKRLYPGNSELHVLQEGIGKLAMALDLDAIIRRAKAAIAQDDWLKAQSVYAAAMQRYPNNKTIQDGLQLSNKLVSLHRTVTNYLSRPERLSSQNVASGAQQALDQTRIFARNSPSLGKQAAALRAMLVRANVKVSVMVRSDNKTYILVRGVGKVGLTDERMIQLKPGTYTFEGLRKGYKSKLVEVRIPVGTKAWSVEVICDERI